MIDRRSFLKISGGLIIGLSLPKSSTPKPKIKPKIKYRYWEDRNIIISKLKDGAVNAIHRNFDYNSQWGISYDNGKKGKHRRRRGVRFFDHQKYDVPDFVYQGQIDKIRKSLIGNGFIRG